MSRILHLVRSLHVGGLEKVVLDLAKGSVEKGIECHLGCLVEEGEWGVESRESGIWRDTWVGDLEYRNRLSVVRDLARYIKAQGITLVHTHNPHPHLFGVAASISSHVPLVHTKHGRNYPKNPRRVWLNRQLARFSRKIVAVSENVASVAREIEKVPAEKVCVVRNGVEVTESGTPTHEQLRKQLGIPERAFVVGSVGRLSPEKNYELLIRAFAEFKKSCSPASPATQQLNNSTTDHEPWLVIVGDGPERGKLEELVRRLGISDNVIMPGMQADVAPWLNCMDLFCLSSLSEGTCITLLEAYMAGLPALVTDVGGNSEIVIDGKSGRLFSSGDEGAMASLMAELSRDVSKREEMGRVGREHVAANYSLKNMVSAYLDIYNSILENKR